MLPKQTEHSHRVKMALRTLPLPPTAVRQRKEKGQITLYIDTKRIQF